MSISIGGGFVVLLLLEFFLPGDSGSICDDVRYLFFEEFID